MSNFEKVVRYLENAEEGSFVENEETSVYIEVTNMCGGRYLVFDKNGEVIRQTDSAAIAFKYLKYGDITYASGAVITDIFQHTA